MPLRKNSITQQVQDIPQETLDAWAAANNPKAAVWEDYTPPEPEPYVEPVPQEVGSGQIRAALVALGWITLTNPSNADAEVDAWASALIELAVSDPGQKAIAHLLWRNASGFKRENQFILLVATILEKTSEETDTLFRTAATF